MPRGPKGEKRPADVIGAAVKVMQIATGETEEELTDDGKNKAAVELGRRGGKARAKSLTKKRRSEIAKKAAAKRWTRAAPGGRWKRVSGRMIEDSVARPTPTARLSLIDDLRSRPAPA